MGAQLSYLYSTISYVYPTLKYGTYALSSYLTFLLLRFYIYDRTYEKEPPPKSLSKTVLKKIRGKGKVQESLKTSPKPTVQLSTFLAPISIKFVSFLPPKSQPWIRQSIKHPW